ncbi:MAG TPA: hypothetical protein VNJ11_03910 [Bryobacteraceae bacterium]|nr:hypothetical protein [Bryobacteraceae bacterium]
MAKKKRDRATAIRRLARERVGRVPPSSVILSKAKRKKPKHKKRLAEQE